jgi:anhydro-N-acetylmuramic acid kinase
MIDESPELLTAIGLMSGTSMDGIEAALITTDGRTAVRPGMTLSLPFDGAMRSLLWEAVQRAASLTRPDERDEVLSQAEEALTHRHADAVSQLRDRAGDAARHVDVIGFHGQTVLHRPDLGFTVQLGLGELLARLTGIDVVNDFRANDMRHGGQGAPLAPAYHVALSEAVGTRPVAFLNLGGVANVTWIGDGDPLAFDTGPANGLIDQWMLDMAGCAMDADGECAARGTVDAAALLRLCDNGFFAAAPPKSLDRFDFTLDAVRGLSLEDGAATLTAFTAEALALALEHLPSPPAVWIVSGGGRRNPVLMEALGRRLPGVVSLAEAVGQRGDSIEAEAFAYLAVRSVKRLPLSFPTTTGVAAPMTGGRLHRPGPPPEVSAVRPPGLP